MDSKTERELISEQMRKEGGSSKGSLSAQMQSDVAKKHVCFASTKLSSIRTDLWQNAEKVDASDGKHDSLNCQCQNCQCKPCHCGQSQADKTAAEQSHQSKEHNFDVEAERVKSILDNDPDHLTERDVNVLASRDARAHGTVEKGSITAEAQRVMAKKRRDSNIQEKREEIFDETSKFLEAKVQQEPESIDKEDAAWINSVDMKAHGKVAKGSVTAKIQSLAAKNEQGSDKVQG